MELGCFLLVFVGLQWFLSACAGATLGKEHGRESFGLVLGMFFGPLGVIAAAVLPDTRKVAVEKAMWMEAQLAKRRGSGAEQLVDASQDEFRKWRTGERSSGRD